MGLADVAGAATGGGVPGTSTPEQPQEPKIEEPKDESLEYSTNNGYHVFDGDVIKDVVDRNMRDDLFSNVDTLLREINEKVTKIDVDYEGRVAKMREALEGLIPKEAMATKLKLAELYKKEDEIHEQEPERRLKI